MKLWTFLVLPILALSLLPASHGQAATCANSAQQAEHIQLPCLGFENQWLSRTINEYATPDLKAQLEKDFAEQEQLRKEWRQSPAFRKHKDALEKQHPSLHQGNSAKVGEILKQVQEGKLNIPQAQQKLQALHHHHQGVKHGLHRSLRQLKEAAANKDRTAVQAALKDLDQKIKASNQRLKSKISGKS